MSIYDQVIAELRPQPGDFFLTASRTGANERIRSWSNSPYGHAILYLGRQNRKTITLVSGGTLGLYTNGYANTAFELPINVSDLGKILTKDKCFELACIKAVGLNAAARAAIVELTEAFIAAKFDAKNATAGYSSNMAMIYAPADTASAFLRIERSPLSPFAILSKLANGLVQSAVELATDYPNLNCSSYVAWVHSKAARRITTFSTTTSPLDLYLATKSNSAFRMTEHKFSV